MQKFNWTHMGVGFDCVCSLWFLRPDCAQSLLSSSVSSRAFVMHSSSGVNRNVTARGSFYHLRPLPAARPECPVPPVVEGCFYLIPKSCSLFFNKSCFSFNFVYLLFFNRIKFKLDYLLLQSLGNENMVHFWNVF